MAQLDGSDIVYVARVSVPKIISLRVEIGTRFPALQTSQGKVLLAALEPRPSLDRVLSRAEPVGAACLHRPHGRDDCEAELTVVRARGWALADEELAPGVRSVAVPVRDGAGRVRAAAMNVTVTPPRPRRAARSTSTSPAAARRRRDQRRMGDLAEPPARRDLHPHRHRTA